MLQATRSPFLLYTQSQLVPGQACPSWYMLITSLFYAQYNLEISTVQGTKQACGQHKLACTFCMGIIMCIICETIQK